MSEFESAQSPNSETTTVPAADLVMTPAEDALFCRVLACRPRSFLSYGIGSTVARIACSGVKDIVAVDSVSRKVETFKLNSAIKPLVESEKAKLLYADIGTVNEWGNPVDNEKISSWPGYALNCWKEFTQGTPFPDVIHVRGRFRVACGLSVGLALPKKGRNLLPTSPLVLLNDMSDDRIYYGVLRRFYEVVARADSLIVARWNDSVPNTELVSTFAEFQFDPR